MKARRNSTARNVFEDLGFAPPQAMNLQLRATMMDILIAEIENRGLTQARAAKVLGITQPRVSDLMRGKLHLFSIDTLVVLLSAMGLKVGFTIRKAA